MGFFTSKKSNSAITTNEPSLYSAATTPQLLKDSDSSYSSFSVGVEEIEKKDVEFKRRIRVLRFIFRCVSLVLSGLMIGTLSYTLASYFATLHQQWEGSHVWGGPKVLWPTYLILSVSIITFVLNVVTIVAYRRGIGEANKTAKLTVYIGYFMVGIEVVVWVASATMYKMTDTGTDLWGYSCGKQADKALQKSQSFVNFGMLCKTQNGTWFITIIQTTLHLLKFVTLVFVFRRIVGKKRIARIRSNQVMENGYYKNTETGFTLKPSGWKRYIPLSGASSKF